MAGERVSIRLLGQFRFSVEPVPARQALASPADKTQLGRRAAELLQLLSLQPQRCLLREQVVEALWPHLGPEAGSAILRKAAHLARQFAGLPDTVVLRSGRVFLLPDHDVDCDATSFEQAADAALAAADSERCREAAGRYGGELLPSARYAPWTEAARQRLRDKYLRLLRVGGQREQLAREEPGDEAAHLSLMRRELAAGRRSGALRWHGHLRDHLQQSMGVKPGPEVEALYRECVEGLHGDAPAFVGRALELVRMLVLLRNAAAGGPGAALLRAPAGMGKTAFCRRLSREARDAGWQVRAVQAGDWTRPYGLATDLVEPLLQEGGADVREAIGPHALAVLSAMTPAAGPPQAMALPIGRHQVVGAVRRLLLAGAGGKPVLLIVDDAHAADDGSAEVLAQLAASGAPLFVLLACRPALPAVLDRHLARMLRAGTLDVVELGPLAEQEAALLVARSSPAPLQPEAVASLATLAEGLPFAVIELARAAAQLAGAAGAQLPRSLASAIAARLGDEDEAGMQALRSLALAA